MNTLKLVPSTVTLTQTKLLYNVINVNAADATTTLYVKLLSDTGKPINEFNKVLPLSDLALLSDHGNIAGVNSVLTKIGVTADTDQSVPAPAKAEDLAKAGKA